MNCPNCGQPVRPGARFCSNCGEDLRHPAAATMVMAPPTAGAPSDATASTVVMSAVPSDLTVPPRTKHKWYRPSRTAILVVVAVTAIAYLVYLAALDPHRANIYWYVARATGFIAYGLLTLSVAVGLVVATRWRAFTGPWLVAERLHPLTLLLALMFLSFHIVAILYLSFPVTDAFIPFVSSFAPQAITLGIIAMYLMIALFISTYIIRYIGYRTWHIIHYSGLLAWFMAIGHAIRVGDDSNTAWARIFYAGGAVIIVLLLLTYLGIKIMEARARRRALASGTT